MKQLKRKVAAIRLAFLTLQKDTTIYIKLHFRIQMKYLRFEHHYKLINVQVNSGVNKSFIFHVPLFNNFLLLKINPIPQ